MMVIAALMVWLVRDPSGTLQAALDYLGKSDDPEGILIAKGGAER